LDSINDSSIAPTETLNYFNYFTEVEEEFVRRRGKHMLISTLDWALVESWKDAGIPLHIVLRAINEAFDGYDARAEKYRKVNSIFYCQQQVEASFAEYRLAQVGGEPSTGQSSSEKTSDAPMPAKPEAFPKDVLFGFLARCDDELRAAGLHASTSGRAELENAVERARARMKEIIAEVEGPGRVDAEALERDLDGLDRMILDAARENLGEEELKKLRAEAESHLRSYRKKMDKAIYEQTVQNFISRRLREISNIPRMSLFYL
jgi:vacuolar-type H+-ATPase subunit H